MDVDEDEEDDSDANDEDRRRGIWTRIWRRRTRTAKMLVPVRVVVARSLSEFSFDYHSYRCSCCQVLKLFWLVISRVPSTLAKIAKITI